MKTLKKRFLSISIGVFVSLMMPMLVQNAFSGQYEEAKKAFYAKDYSKAVSLFKPLAEADNDDAQWYMGTFYRRGQGVAKSYKTALYWYDRSARNGDSDSQYELAKLYYFGDGTPKDHKTAFKWYLAAAKQGHKEATYDVGYAYKKGEGVRKSYAKALKWYQKASDNNIDKASASLGIMYENGQGTKKDFRKAAKLYAKAADNGNAKGRAYLASMYYFGKGLYTDKKLGIKLYKQAAAMGSKYASSQLESFGVKNDLLGDKAYVAYLKKDFSGAISIWKKRAKHGDVAAMVNLGNIYKNVKDVRDYKKSMGWYKPAVTLGNTEAMVGMGDIYNYALGVPRNYDEAYRMYSSASYGNDPNGIYMFASMYDDGHGVEQDKEKAIKLYELAASMGNSDAKAMLKFYVDKRNREGRWNQMVANLDSIRREQAEKKRRCDDMFYRGTLEASRRSGQYYKYRYIPPPECR